MKGGWGTKYTGAIKNEITNRISDLEKSLEKINQDVLIGTTIPDQVNLKLDDQSYVVWDIEKKHKTRKTIYSKH